jgi:hypothetical protein
LCSNALNPPEDLVPTNPFARTVSLLCVVAVTLVLAACPPHESIESINRDPARFHNQEIRVSGRVVNSFAMMGVGAFEIDDGTGRLWVYSDNYGVPGNDVRVTVIGTIQQGFSFGGRNFATILKQRRPRS